MAGERGVVRKLHDAPRPAAGSSTAARRRYLVPTNDNRPPLPVRLRRPLLLLAILAIAILAAARWLS